LLRCELVEIGAREADAPPLAALPNVDELETARLDVLA
jgi:hypothetical protein